MRRGRAAAPSLVAASASAAEARPCRPPMRWRPSERGSPYLQGRRRRPAAGPRRALSTGLGSTPDVSAVLRGLDLQVVWRAGVEGQRARRARPPAPRNDGSTPPRGGRCRCARARRSRSPGAARDRGRRPGRRAPHPVRPPDIGSGPLVAPTGPFRRRSKVVAAGPARSSDRGRTLPAASRSDDRDPRSDAPRRTRAGINR